MVVVVVVVVVLVVVEKNAKREGAKRKDDDCLKAAYNLLLSIPSISRSRLSGYMVLLVH